jgi:hypothetical protein
MQRQAFRLKTPTLGIVPSDDGHRVAMTIPQDAIVTLINGRLHGNRMVDILWEGKTVTMFTQDLRKRGERVDGASASP